MVWYGLQLPDSYSDSALVTHERVATSSVVTTSFCHPKSILVKLEAEDRNNVKAVGEWLFGIRGTIGEG